MMTALLVARNIMGMGPYDPWRVNTDAEYHEEGESPADDTNGRAVPRAVPGRHAGSPSSPAPHLPGRQTARRGPGR